MEEVWRPIKGFEGVYDVSSLGRIRSYLNNKYGLKEQPKILKGCLCKNGYYSIFLHIPNSKTSVETLIHRIVAQTFIPNKENKKCVDHINTIRTDNRVENLRWVTHKENCYNSITYNRIVSVLRKNAEMLRGSNSPCAKPVGQYLLSGELVNSFGSIVEASEKTGISIRKITHNLNGEQKKAEGFVFKFL